MIGIVCGMASEAGCVARAPCAGRFEVRVSGASAGRADALARELAEAGAEALISFGLSGALDPRCVPGRLLLPTAAVLPSGQTIAADAGLFGRLTARAAGPGGLPALVSPIAGSDEIVASGAAKAALQRMTGAAAVDMETHAVARVAQERGLAWAAIRAVADPADRAIPRTAMAGLAPDGATRPLHVIRELIVRPQDLPALVRLGRDANAGLATLRRAALHLLPVL